MLVTEQMMMDMKCSFDHGLTGRLSWSRTINLGIKLFTKATWQAIFYCIFNRKWKVSLKNYFYVSIHY